MLKQRYWCQHVPNWQELKVTERAGWRYLKRAEDLQLLFVLKFIVYTHSIRFERLSTILELQMMVITTQPCNNPFFNLWKAHHHGVLDDKPHEIMKPWNHEITEHWMKRAVKPPKPPFPIQFPTRGQVIGLIESAKVETHAEGLQKQMLIVIRNVPVTRTVLLVRTYLVKRIYDLSVTTLHRSADSNPLRSKMFKMMFKMLF